MELVGSSRRLPIYLVADVSASMAGAAIDAVNMGLRNFEASLQVDPHALECAYVSVITFGSTAQQATPLTEAGAFNAPTLSAGGGTALGAALRLLSDCMTSDFEPRTEETPGDWRPLAFLLTDGHPTDDWRAGLQDYARSEKSLRSSLIGIACGPKADVSVLSEVSKMVMQMPDMTPERIAALFQWISQSVQVASRSASQQAAAGAETGQADLPPPPEGFRITL